MNAEEIRKDSSKRYVGTGFPVELEHDELFKIRMIQEIAAQLAEMNENMKNILKEILIMRSEV